jgi:hypothetical protein
MKTLISITTAVVMLICLSSAPARADRKTTEGFLLGVGAVVLGTAIYQGLNQSSGYSGYREPQRYHTSPAYGRGSQCRNDQRYVRQPVVRWEIQRIWVEPVFETRRHPGHYNRQSHWAGGRHEKIKVRNGYWEERRVRIRH